MRVLGFDPSLTNFGWALHDTSGTGKDRCVARGRFQTSASTLYVTRYMSLRDKVEYLIEDLKPDHMGLEFPVFGNLFSEGMYGLFLYTSEATLRQRKDVVFWSPLQVKAYARTFIVRPPKWEMGKPDMVEAAKKDTGGAGRWNHNEADAYWVARLSGRFWQFVGDEIKEDDLTPVERDYFTKTHTYKRGKKAGEVKKTGVSYREDERFFRWSQTQEVGYGETSEDAVRVIQSFDARPRSVEEDSQD